MEAEAASQDSEALRRIEAALESDVIERALDAARERLGMDAAYVTTMDARQQTVEAVVGRSNAPIVPGLQTPLEETYCARMLKHEIPNIVPDTRADPALRDLSATRYVGAYVGVPVRLANGRLHGTLCCVSSEPHPGLGEAELRFMHVLAAIVAARIDQVHGDLSRLMARLRGGGPAG